MPVASPSAPAGATCRLLIVDDHPVSRHGASHLLRGMEGVTICGEAEDASAALKAIRQMKPDMALIDISAPGASGIELIKAMLATEPRLLVLVVSIHDESLYALRALRAGARGYVMKQQAPENLLEAVRKVMAGGIYVSPEFSERLVVKAIQGSGGDIASPVDKLSDRELEVLQFLGRRRSTREIAERLHLSVKTIETHRAHIKEKLGFKDADEMVRFAVEWTAATEG